MRRRDKAKIFAKTANKKQVILVLVIIVAAAAALATLSSILEGCVLGTQHAYAGQAVDEEQALAKLSGYASGVNRTQFGYAVPVGQVDFRNAKVVKVSSFKAKFGNATIMENGYLFNVPHKENGQIALRDDGYFLSDKDGNLYRVKSVGCY